MMVSLILYYATDVPL